MKISTGVVIFLLLTLGTFGANDRTIGALALAGNKATVFLPLPHHKNARPAQFGTNTARFGNVLGNLITVQFIWDSPLQILQYLPSQWTLFFVPTDVNGKSLIGKPILITKSSDPIMNVALVATDRGFGITYSEGKTVIWREYSMDDQSLSVPQTIKSVPMIDAMKHTPHQGTLRVAWSSYSKVVYALTLDNDSNVLLMQSRSSGKAKTLKKIKPEHSDIAALDLFVDATGIYTFWTEFKLYCGESSCTLLYNEHCLLDGTSCQTQKQEVSADLIKEFRLADIAFARFPDWLQQTQYVPQIKLRELGNPPFEILFQ